jgi:hypothetical protein
MRAVASVPPPAPAGTMIVTGFSGHAAMALPLIANATPTAQTANAWNLFKRLMFMFVSYKELISATLNGSLLRTLLLASLTLCF